MSKPVTIEQVMACPQLPSLPAVAIKVLELTQDKNVDLVKIAEQVQLDPALSSRVLRTVNSSYYGLSRPCPTILRAIAFLGLNLVNALVLGFSLVDMSKDRSDAFDYNDYWRRSLYAAVAARRLASLSGGCDPDEAFTSALMQDIGMLAFAAFDRDMYAAVAEGAGTDHCVLPGAEGKAYGFDHCELGARLAEKWRLPESIVESIRGHHAGLGGSTRVTEMIPTIVAVASSAAVVACGGGGEHGAEQVKRIASQFRPEDIDEVFRRLPEDAAQLEELFNVKIGRPEMTNLMDDAEQRRIGIEVRMQREKESEREKVESLSRAARTDGLTEIGNRAHFDTELKIRFEHAREVRGSLGLVVMDVDHFKSVNDTYGHPAGDVVLVEVARRIVSVIRDGDAACRMGGEEFGLLVPNANLKSLIAVGERIRRTVFETPFPVEGLDQKHHELTISISIGLALLDDRSRQTITSARAFVRMADEAMYAAKHGGRNTVRMYGLRKKSA